MKTGSGALTSGQVAEIQGDILEDGVIAESMLSAGVQEKLAAASPAGTLANLLTGITPAQLDQLRTLLAGSGATFSKGINLGGVFDAPWDGANGVPFARAIEVCRRYKEAGFDHIRIPVRWTSHATSAAAAVIDSAFMLAVEKTVDYCLANGLGVIINAHHYRQLDGDALNTSGGLGDPTDVQTADVRPRLLNIWRQVAARFKNRGPALWFEPYNEPHGQLDETDSNSQSTRWSLFFQSIVSAIREQDTTRPILIGASNYNNADALNWMTWPTTGGPYVTALHNYHNIDFSHQGFGSYPAAGTVPLRASHRAAVRCANLSAKEYAAAKGTYVHIGEFGAAAATAADRVAYIAMCRREAELAGIGWCVWTDSSGQAGSFNLWDTNYDWIPGMRDALFGIGEPSAAPALPASILTVPTNQTFTQWNGTVLPAVNSAGRVSFGAVSTRQTVIAAITTSQQLVEGQTLQFSNTGIGNCRFILAVQKKAGTPDLSAGFVYPGQARTMVVPAAIDGDDPIANWKLFLQIESSTAGTSGFTPHVCVVS